MGGTFLDWLLRDTPAPEQAQARADIAARRSTPCDCDPCCPEHCTCPAR